MLNRREQNGRFPSLSERIRRRFKFLSWPLTIFDQSPELRRPDFPLNEKAKRTKFPFRALKYWWIACAIQEEVRQMNRPLVIADVGCWKGILNRFIPSIEGASWIGLDLHLNEKVLALAYYLL